MSVTAVNLGDRATTITNLGFLYYDSWLGAMVRRGSPAKAFIITTPSPAQMLPFRFEAGAQWIGMALQGDDLVEMIRDGHLFVALYHSHGGNGVRFRLKLKEFTT